MRAVVVTPLVVCLAASVARAQERLHFESMPDTRLDRLTLPKHAGPQDEMRVEWLGGAQGAEWRGDATGSTLGPFFGFGLGLWGDAMNNLAIYSESLLPAGAQPRSSDLKWSDLEGSHRFRAEVDFGKPEKDELGLSAQADASLDHASSTSASFLRRDVGPTPFWDARARATLWPRIDENDTALVTPVSFGIRRVATESPDVGYTTQRASAGLGLRGAGHDKTRGWLEVAGIGWESTRFDSRAPSLAGVEQIDVRALGVNRIEAEAESDMSIFVSANYGGAWLWDGVTHRSASTFTFDAALELVMFPRIDGGKRVDEVTFGAALARRAGFLADGSSLTRSLRAEGIFDVALREHRMGGSVRVATEQLDLITRQADGGYRTTIASEVYLSPVHHLQLGVFETTTDLCPIAIAAPGAAWCHQLGAFARVWDRDAKQHPAPPPPPPRSRVGPTSEEFDD